LDIEPALVGNNGDTINSVNIEVDPSQPGDLSVDNISADGYMIVIWLSCGQAGTTYNVTVKASMASGRTLQRTMLLPVIALSSPSVPANAIETTTQDPLTDENGNPIVNS
jgi:predicted dienelactone hydrolase